MRHPPADGPQRKAAGGVTWEEYVEYVEDGDGYGGIVEDSAEAFGNGISKWDQDIKM